MGNKFSIDFLFSIKNMALYHLKKYVLPKCPPKCPPSPPKMSSQKSSQTEMGGQILPFGRTLVTLFYTQ